MKLLIKPLEIYVTIVHQVISFNGQTIHCLAVMHLAFREMKKSGNVTPETEKRVHLDGTSSVIEVRPRAKFETKFYGTAVKSIDYYFDAKTVVVFVQSFLASFIRYCARSW